VTNLPARCKGLPPREEPKLASDNAGGDVQGPPLACARTGDLEGGSSSSRCNVCGCMSVWPCLYRSRSSVPKPLSCSSFPKTLSCLSLSLPSASSRGRSRNKSDRISAPVTAFVFELALPTNFVITSCRIFFPISAEVTRMGCQGERHAS